MMAQALNYAVVVAAAFWLVPPGFPGFPVYAKVA